MFRSLVATFSFLLLAGFSHATNKAILEKFSDVTCVVHLMERDGHRIMVKIDSESNLGKDAYTAIAALPSDKGWAFTLIEKDEFASDASSVDNNPEKFFLFSDKTRTQDSRNYWLLTEDFFKFQRTDITSEWKGCTGEGQDSESQPFYLMDNSGKKYYLMGLKAEQGAKAEKVIGVFLTEDNKDFNQNVQGTFYGVRKNGEDHVRTVGPKGVQAVWSYAQVFCKTRHPPSAFPLS